MFNCNDLISKSVLSISEGDLIGVVDKLFFDKKIKKLLSLEILSEDGKKFILNSKNIYNVGKNAITIKSNQMLTLKVENLELNQAPLNFKAYSFKGEFLGQVVDLSLNKKFVTEKIVLDNNKTIEINNLASCGKTTVIFYNSLNSENQNNLIIEPKVLKLKEPEKVTTLPLKTEQKEETKEQKMDKSYTIQNTDFLLGRICTKDIFNFNNELLIKAHGIVTKKNLKELKKYGKIRELMLFSK